MSASYCIELLGCFRISLQDGETVDFRAQKTASLLAFLALNLDRTHSREELADRFWPDAYRDSGRMNLRTALSSLRRELKAEEETTGAAELLIADRQYIRLNPAIVTTDARRFEDLLRQAARETDSAAKIAAFSQAISLYRGPLLPGFYDDWVVVERERLQMLQARALRGLVAAHIAIGERERALEYAYEVLKLEPLDEESHAEVMRLHAAAGRSVAVTRQFRELQRRLKEELDAEPSEAVQNLYQRLLQERPTATVAEGSEGGEPAPPPQEPAVNPLPVAAPPPREMAPLPVPLTRFFGREDEIGRILRLLGVGEDAAEDASDRIVTLTGPGGSGKTRLAIEVGRRLVKSQIPVCFVALADVTRTDVVPGVILKALNVTPEAGDDLRDQVVRLLASQTGVLILDSFEQIAEEGAGLVQAILSEASELRVLVTSRQRLDVGGEQEFPVQPLPVPNLPGLADSLEQIPSVQLFLDRAHAASPDFKITRENAAAVSAICERLDGIPLALELAAPWVRTLTPAQILSRLDDRFQLLTSRRKDLPVRHRTLRSAIDWSFQTLEPEVQRFFANLSVFRGAWTLAAAEAVCEEPLALEFLYALQERSLILAVSDSAEDMRYRFLETLREYGRKQLTEEEREALAHRHAVYFRDFAQEQRPLLDSLQQATVLELLEADHDNFRAALEWAIATPNNEAWAIAQGLCCALFRFWTIRGYSAEGRRWLRQTLAFGEDDPPDYLRAHVLYFAGSFALTHSDLDDATHLFTQALAAMRAIGNKAGIVNTICRLGLVQAAQRDFAGAETTFREGLALARADGNISSEGHLLKCLGVVVRERGDYAQARTLFEQGMAIGKTWGDPHGISMMLGEQGYLALLEGDLDRAQSLLEEQLTLARQLKALGHQGGALKMLARVAIERGNWEQADALCQQSIALFRSSGERGELAHGLLLLTVIFLKRDLAGQIAPCLQESLDIYLRLENRAALKQGIETAASLAALQQRYTDAARLWGTADAILDTSPPPFTDEFLGDLFWTLRQTTTRILGEAGFSREYKTGMHLSLEDAARLVASF